MTDSAATRGSSLPTERSTTAYLTPLRTIFGIDYRTLALFRVMLGLYLIVDICLRFRDLTAHYSDEGVLPRHVQSELLSATSWSLHLINGFAAYQALLFIAAAIAATGMVLGWRTRSMTILSWILLYSLHNRNIFILSGEDNLALLLLFWSMFLPLGARYSVDEALDRRSNYNICPPQHFSMATTALLIQGMSMYFFSAILKSDPVWYPDGLAVYYALNLDYMVTAFGVWFRQFETVLQGLTYYVLALETVGPILIFTPIFHRAIRSIVMILFMTMHVGFWLFLEIGMFPVISIVMNIAFMPSWMWDWVARKLDGRLGERVSIWYDRDCEFCLKICRILMTFLVLPRARIEPAQNDPAMGPLLEANNSWIVGVGEIKGFKWDAMCILTRASPIFGPLSHGMRFPGIRHVGDRIYEAVANHRHGLSILTKQFLPWKSHSHQSLWVTNGVVGILLGFVTFQNLSTVPGLNINLSKQLVLARQGLGLFQNWTMFAPYPELRSIRPVVEGNLDSGQTVDVYRQVAGMPSNLQPKIVSKIYQNYRWRKFLANMEDRSYQIDQNALALGYAEYLCQQWDDLNENDRKLRTLRIGFRISDTPPPDVPRLSETRSVHSHSCR